MEHSKRRLGAVCTLILCCLCWTLNVFAYGDVQEDSWYAQAVDYVTEHGLFQGTEEDLFSPEASMTRAMFVTVLCRADNGDRDTYPDAGFTDVPPDAYYTQCVNWGKARDLVKGTEDTLFSPDDPVSREQICTLISRYADYLGFQLPANQAPAVFTDGGSISEYAQAAVTACQAAGLVNGYPEGDFRPQASATRAEVATIFFRLGTLLEAAGYSVGPDRVDSGDWRLMLVNRWNPIPEGYVDTISLVDTPWGEAVDARMYEDCMAMMQGLDDAGIYAYIDSGFRSNSIQEYLFNRKVNQYISYGYSYGEAQEAAEQWVARPGTSEHEIGLALDISMYADNADTVHWWLSQHAWEYGFIYRYPADKESVTGVHQEPWHYRYVGREYAKRIYDSGLTLEEFLAQYAA